MNFEFKVFKTPKADWQNYLQDVVKGNNEQTELILFIHRK